jgi:hypothetical protein
METNMRITIDLPDDLHRRAKETATSKGRRLRDLVEEGLRRAATAASQERPEKVPVEETKGLV